MQKFYLGKVVKPQGVKGELKIKPNVDSNSMIEKLTTVFFNQNEEPVKIVKIVYRLGFIYLTIDGLTDRTTAENYRNFKVYAIKEEIVTKEEEFFIEDLVGQDIYDKNGSFVGNILEIENYGANDIIIILEDKREYSVAFLKEIFVSISKDKIIIDREKYDEAKIWE